MRRFYWQCIKLAFTSGWDAANNVSLLVGLGIGALLWRLPQFRNGLEPLAWLLPVGAFAALFLHRFARAPWELYRESEKRVRTAEERGEAAMAELKETRDCQAIADYLTKEHEYGIHELLHKPPKNLEELPEWSRWVENWNNAIFLKMEQLGCTPQDLNHVRTISILDVTAGLSEVPAGTTWFSSGDSVLKMWTERLNRQAAEAARTIEIPVRMHAVRLSRVADVSTRYARRAEELRLAATKQLLAIR